MRYIAEDLDSFREQLIAGIDVNSIDEKGISLLHKAVIIGNIDLVKLLVDNGADLDIELPRLNSNHMRLTPILYALIHNKKNIVRKLFTEMGGMQAIKKSQQSLRSWQKQKWRTKSGKRSQDTGERYMPEEF